MKRKRVVRDFSKVLPSSKRRKLEKKSARKIDVYSWGQGSYALFHKSEDEEVLPRLIEDFDPKYDIGTYQLLINGVTVVFDERGGIYSFGNGDNGQLGHGDENYVLEPKRIEVLSEEKIVQICGGYFHTLFRNDRLEVFGCGANDDWQAIGRQGDNGSENVVIPVLVQLSARLSFIACGACNGGGLNETRTKILTWGSNAKGMLGNGSMPGELRRGVAQEMIGEIQGEWRVDAVCMGYWHSLMLTTSVADSPTKKKLWICGGNRFSQHGNGTFDVGDYPVASTIRYFEERNIDIKNIACGNDFNAVIALSGSLFMWGGNDSGECGIRGVRAVNVPRRVSFGESSSMVLCLSVSCSYRNCLALIGEMNSTLRSLYSWGYRTSNRDERDETGLPKEIPYFVQHEEADCMEIVKIGVGDESYCCFVQKTLFHMNDLDLQDEKLDFLRDLNIL